MGKKFEKKKAKVLKMQNNQQQLQQPGVLQTNLCASPNVCSEPNTVCLSNNNYRIRFEGFTAAGGFTSLRYTVCSCGNPAISNFGFEICPPGVEPVLDLQRTINANPGVTIEIVEVGSQANEFGFRYVKFEGLNFNAQQCREVTLVFQGQFDPTGSTGGVGVKAGQNIATDNTLPGVAGLCGCPFDLCECPTIDNTYTCTITPPTCLTRANVSPRVAVCVTGNSSSIEQCRVAPDGCGGPSLNCTPSNCRDRLYVTIDLTVYVAVDYEDECGNTVSLCCEPESFTVEQVCFGCVGQFSGMNCMACEHLIIGTPVFNPMNNTVSVDFDIDCSTF